MSRLVLIESDWNLKLTAKCVQGGNARVLIESDWNLKWVTGQAQQPDL